MAYEANVSDKQRSVEHTHRASAPTDRDIETYRQTDRQTDSEGVFMHV